MGPPGGGAREDRGADGGIGGDDTEWMPGNVGGALRVGGTVLRPTGPWTPAVHALLDHLAAAGLEGVPRVLGRDGDREVLEYLPGHSLQPGEDLATDEQLTGAVRWIGRYHAAVADFRPREPLLWRGHAHPEPLRDDLIVCHNDPGVYNWVVRDGAFAGLIDWDMAGPGRPIDDVAFLCWTGVPIIEEVPVAERARRLRLVADASGFDPLALLDAVEQRMRGAADRIAAGQRRGDPGLLRLGELGEPAATLEDLDRHLARRPALEAALAAPTGPERPGPG